VSDVIDIRTERIEPAPRIAIDRCGSGPLVVFLHGIGGHRGNWSDQLRRLAGRFTAVAWDARGWGDSDDYEGPLSFDDLSSDLLRVLSHCDAERAHLVGLSMGGRICLDFWRRYPGRVASLVLTSTSAGLHEDVGIEKRREFLEQRRRPLLDGGSTADMARKVAPGLVSAGASDAVRQQAIESLSALRKDSYLKALETITWYEEFPPFASVSAPTLIISGTEDYLCRPDMSQRMAREIPGAERMLLENCGHLCNLEYPERYNGLLYDFLLRIENRRT